MDYLQVKDLKKPRELWEKLKAHHELVITRDGRPKAIMIDVEPENLEQTLQEIRRVVFSAAVGRVRQRAQRLPDADESIRQAISDSRQAKS